ncbi:MAG: YdbL family protein [Candidatus Aminicenantes bacterium]|nr:YdbL family protein [Candidatus Aminicenantes bacterium]
MKCKNLVIFLIVLFISGAFLCAKDANVKERMLKRKPLINALKDQGKLGENNVGKLAPRGGLNPEERRLMNEENGDRDIIYGRIAQNMNVSPAEVGKRRAAQIAQRAKPGHWLQNPQGKWYRKK